MPRNDPSDPRFIFNYTPGAFRNMENQIADLDQIAEQAGFDYIDEVLPMKDYFEDVDEEAAYWEGKKNLYPAEREAQRRALLRPNKGYGYNNLGDAVSPGAIGDVNYTLPAASMFQIIMDDRVEAPTATTDPDRPRTVAAFYEPLDDEDNSGVVTLMFRDGTLYNYYDVTEKEWLEFRRATSKGGPDGPIATTLDLKQRGPADVSDIPAELRAWYNYAARRAQYAMRGARMAPKHMRSTKKGTPYKHPRGKIKEARQANIAYNKQQKKLGRGKKK